MNILTKAIFHLGILNVLNLCTAPHDFEIKVDITTQIIYTVQ